MHKSCWQLAHADAIQGVAFSPDGRVLATAGNDGLMRLLDVETGKQIRAMSGHNASVRSIAFSPDGKMLASGGSDGTVRLWDRENGELTRQFELPKSDEVNWAMSIVFAYDGDVIASACIDGRIQAWNVDSGECFHSVKYQSSTIWGIAASPDGKSLAMTGKHQPIILRLTEAE
jgi:WD40 repeat protein